MSVSSDLFFHRISQLPVLGNMSFRPPKSLIQEGMISALRAALSLLFGRILLLVFPPQMKIHPILSLICFTVGIMLISALSDSFLFSFPPCPRSSNEDLSTKMLLDDRSYSCWWEYRYFHPLRIWLAIRWVRQGWPFWWVVGYFIGFCRTGI